MNFQQITPSQGVIYISVPKYEAPKGYSQEPQVNPKDTKMLSKMEHLKKKLKALQGIGAYGTVDMGDLCFFPNLVIPPKFNPRECEKYNRMTFPILHLTMYTRSMAAFLNKEKLMVYYI